QENQQNFAVARTYTLVREAWPGPLVDTASNAASARKDKLLQFSPSLEDSSSSRYQNFSKGSRRRSDASYIHPFVTDYFDCGQFQKPPEDEDDTNSYENVLICEPKKTESGDEESEGYQNSASIRQWQESRRVVGHTSGKSQRGRDRHTIQWSLSCGRCGGGNRAGHVRVNSLTICPRVAEPVPREAPPYPVGSPDEDDGEPDYVNGDVAAIKA
ncbi:hypothetical protein EI555_018016, partial [Monodon monoceros]